MEFSQYRYLVRSDLYRIAGEVKFSALLKELRENESFQYIFWMRTCRFTKKHPVLRFFVFPIAAVMLRKYMYKYGIAIPYTTEIDAGFYVGHFGGIVVNGLSKIGKNCNLSHGVTLGKANRGKNAGYPTIGDHVYIGPGAKIVGAVKVGNHAAIGANCVVTKDVPEHAVVVGIPGRVISYQGSKDYVNYTDYEDKISPAGEVVS
jgi:serine O-acetyltransferase